ncbi:hem-containing dehydratase protein [Echria macrotheca]|uniref:Hem-containing dehydratase protein n=1 Tax=Echria macrotheca TaxID=438768 RepID=A0AAJ0B8Y8_9PEZI|nr:hem-containing dehydratase protein [Echria macrotheca]
MINTKRDIESKRKANNIYQLPKMLVSAIPTNLQCPRTQPARIPKPDFEPPYPCHAVLFPQDVSQLVIAIIGAQHKPSSDPTATEASRSTISTFLSNPTASTPPSFFEWASVTDNKDFLNFTALAYWPSKSAYETWTAESGFQTWWTSLDPSTSPNGWFLEVFLPTTDRFETMFNTPTHAEGSAHMRESMSDPIREHGYWGSMRDRLPLSQTDPLTGTPDARPSTTTTAPISNNPSSSNKRIIIPGKKNLTIIRSGQDWHDTTPKERDLYLSTMHPVLTRGMDFLRDNGSEVGCYSCRLMDIVDAKTGSSERIDRTFGLAYFDELASLERWSREHPTHLAIFGGFMQYARTLGDEVTLKVFHEVMVLREDQQFFEYVGCHGGTGMLAAGW